MPTRTSVEVSLDLSGGNTLGLKLKKTGPAGGASVKSLDAGGQAERTGKFFEGQAILKINGEDITQKAMKDVGGLIKSRPICKMTLEGSDDMAEAGDADLGNNQNDLKVTLSRAPGVTLGVKLMKDPATGQGCAIKSVDAGGQAETTGLIKAGMVVLKINGTAVADVKGMKAIGELIKAKDTVEFSFAGVDLMSQVDTDGDGKVSEAEAQNAAKKFGGAIALQETETINTTTTEAEVTLDTGSGQTLGLKLMKNPATGKGVCVKSVDVGGQAEKSGAVKADAIIIEINGTNVETMKMKDVGALIKGAPNNRVKFKLRSSEEVRTVNTEMDISVKAAAPPKAAEPEPTPKAAEPAPPPEPEQIVHQDGKWKTTGGSTSTITTTLDTSGGGTLGLKLQKNPATGIGCAVKSLDPGGLAEKTGKFTVGVIILKINGTDVTQMKMKQIGPIIKSSPKVVFELEGGATEGGSGNRFVDAAREEDEEKARKKKEEDEEKARKKKEEDEEKARKKKEEDEEKARKKKEEDARSKKAAGDADKAAKKKAEDEEKERKRKQDLEEKERKEKQDREDRERREKQEREDRERKEREDRERKEREAAAKVSASGGGGVSSKELEAIHEKISSVQTTVTTHTRDITTLRSAENLEPRVRKLEQAKTKMEGDIRDLKGLESDVRALQSEVKKSSSSSSSSSGASSSEVVSLKKTVADQTRTIKTMETTINNFNAEFLSFKTSISSQMSKTVKTNEFDSFKSQTKTQISNASTTKAPEPRAPAFDPSSVTKTIKSEVDASVLELRREISVINVKVQKSQSVSQANGDATRERASMVRRITDLEREVAELKGQLEASASVSSTTVTSSRTSRRFSLKPSEAASWSPPKTATPKITIAPAPAQNEDLSGFGSSSTDELPSAVSEKLRELFLAADQSDGQLSFDTASPDMYLDHTELNFRLHTRELEKLLKDSDLMGIIDRNNDGNLSTAELIAHLDTNNDGKISIQEFIEGLNTGGVATNVVGHGRESVAQIQGRLGADSISPGKPARPNSYVSRQSNTWNQVSQWDDPRNAGRPRAASTVANITGFTAESYTIQTLLKKCFSGAESSGGELGGSYIKPDRVFSTAQMQYMIDERECTHALGRMKTFDPSKGSSKTINDIFQKLPLDPSGKLSVLTFLAMCDPLTMVRQALNKAVEPGEGALVTSAQIPRGTKNKLENMFIEKPGTGDAAWKTDRHTALNAKEAQYRLAITDLLILIKEVCEFEMFDTVAHGKLSIPQIVSKVDKMNRGNVGLGEFVNTIGSKATAEKSSRIKEKKAAKSRFGTFGRRKKNKELDATLGIAPDGDQRGTPIQAIFSKQPLLY